MLELVRETVRCATRVDLRFGQGPNGEVYLLSKQDGFVRRLNLNVPEPEFGAIVLLLLIAILRGSAGTQTRRTSGSVKSIL